MNTKAIHLSVFSLMALVTLHIPLSHIHAQENVHSFDFSVENDLIRLKDFQNMRQGVITFGIDSLEGVVPTKPLETINADGTFESEPVSDTEVTENKSEETFVYQPTLKERRLAAHDKWRLMTKEEKEKFFEDLSPEAEERLRKRREFLKTRLELRPTRGGQDSSTTEQ